MEKIKFEEIKVDLKEKIDRNIPYSWVKEEGGFTLVDGFFMQPIQAEISRSFIIGGPTVPMVAIVGNHTGRMYFFALKKLMPDLIL